MIGLLIFLLFALLLIGMPIGFVLLAVGSLGILLIDGYGTLQNVFSTTVYRSVNNFSLSTIPLFIVMAHFISKSRIADDLFESLMKWIGHKPGGVGITAVFASAGLGTLTGSSVAANSVMSEIAVPRMIEMRYSKSFASGLIASSTGTLAALIPPSIPLILYGVQTENSIGKLLIAGILPGILLAILLSLTVFFVGLKTDSKTEKYSWKERFLSLKTVWPAVALVLLVVAIIYLGVATPSEAASFGAIGALIIGVSLRRLNIKQIVDALLITARQTTMIFIIIIGAHVLAYYITMTGFSNQVLQVISDSGLPAWGVLTLIIIIYLILGMFMEIIGSMLLTLPIVYPLIINLGYDPIWFGIILVLVLEIGLVTPPVGINLFITNQHTGIPVGTIFKGSIPFIGILLLTIVILTLFPQIILLLPTLM